jgi:hypothetical protein
MEHKQYLYNNNIIKTPIINTNLILNSLHSSDDQLINFYHNKINDIQTSKLQLIYYLLKNHKINFIEELIKFIKILNITNIEHNMSNFNFKEYKNYLFIQCSISKYYYKYEKKYINDIKEFIENNNFKCDFFDITNKRFNKTIDCVFVIYK